MYVGDHPASARIAAPHVPAWLACVGVGVAVTLVWSVFGWGLLDLSLAAPALGAVPLTVVLVARYRSANAHWGAASAAWAAVLGAARGVALALAGAGDDAPKADWLGRLGGYLHALRGRLRGTNTLDALMRGHSASELRELRESSDLPAALLHDLAARLADARRAGTLAEADWAAASEALRDCAKAQAQCEALALAPSSVLDPAHVGRVVMLWSLLLAAGGVTTFGWLTPIVVAVLSGAALAVDTVPHHDSGPFGDHDAGLPLLASATQLENELRRLVGDDPGPDPVPVAGVLR